MLKNIVMIGNTSWGMLRFRGDLMRKLIILGHKVIVIAPKDDYSEEIEKLGARFIPINVDRKGTNPLKDLAYTFRLLRSIINVRANVVLCYTIKPILYGTLASWLAGVPQRIAITTGLGNTFNSENLINKITKILYRINLKFASEVWFLNNEDSDVFIKQKLVCNSKSFVLPGEGVDIEHFIPSGASKVITFTLISRMLWDKGVGIFVECARDLKVSFPSARFLLVGPVDNGNPEGISLAQLDSWHREGVVEYLGARDDIRSILNETTCLIHPTYYKEGLPRVLMEAAAMKIPCITTDIPGCREVIKDGINGFLIPQKNQEALSTAIRRFIELDEQSKRDFSEAGRKIVVEKFSSNLINSTYISRLSL